MKVKMENRGDIRFIGEDRLELSIESFRDVCFIVDMETFYAWVVNVGWDFLLRI